jgi:hypothetical protein
MQLPEMLTADGLCDCCARQEPLVELDEHGWDGDAA